MIFLSPTTNFDLKGRARCRWLPSGCGSEDMILIERGFYPNPSDREIPKEGQYHQWISPQLFLPEDQKVERNKIK